MKFEKSFFITNSQIYQENYTSLAHAASTLIKKKNFNHALAWLSEQDSTESHFKMHRF